MTVAGAHAGAGRLAALPLVVLVLLGLVYSWGAASEGAGIDFYQFWAVGQAVREHLVEDVYAPQSGPRLAKVFMERAQRGGERRQLAAAEFRRDEIQTSNTPFLYATFFAFESGGYEADIRRFRLLGLLLAVASMAALCRAAGYTLGATLAVLAFALWAFSPLHQDLGEGNVNAIQMTALSLCLILSRGRDGAWPGLAAGAALGLGIAFKPNLAFAGLVLAGAWAIRREWKGLFYRVAGMAAGGLLAVAIAAAFFGSIAPWFAWLDTIRNIQNTFGSSLKWGSFGGGRLLLDLTGRNLSPVLYLAALGSIVWAVVKGGGSASSERGRLALEFAVLGIGPLVPLLASDLAWPHYLVQAVPLAIWLGRPGRLTGPAIGLFTLALASICASPFLDLFAAGNDLAYAGTLAAGTLILFVLACLEIARLRSEDEVPAAA